MRSKLCTQYIRHYLHIFYSVFHLLFFIHLGTSNKFKRMTMTRLFTGFNLQVQVLVDKRESSTTIEGFKSKIR